MADLSATLPNVQVFNQNAEPYVYEDGLGVSPLGTSELGGEDA